MRKMITVQKHAIVEKQSLSKDMNENSATERLNVFILHKW